MESPGPERPSLEGLDLPHDAQADPAPAPAQEHRGQGPPPASHPPPAAHPASEPRFDDPDLDSLSLVLDEHARHLRSEVLANLLDAKRRGTERQHEAVAAAAARHARELTAAQAELVAATTQLQRQCEITKRMGKALARAVRWRKQFRLAHVAWRAWRRQAQRRRRLEASAAAAAHHYDVGRLYRGAFRGWRAEAAAVKAQAAAALEEERRRIEAEAGAEAARLAQVRGERGRRRAATP